MKKIFLSLLLLLGLATSSVAEDISAYLSGAHMSVDDAKAKLSGAGYEIVAVYDSVKNGQTIVFTSDELKAEASKEKRAHAAVLRLFVDDKKNMISFTNPVYFGRAFMQDDYNDDIFSAELSKINNTFPGLTGTQDTLEDDDIAGFHFMMGMPYYEDPDELSEGSNSELLAKLQGYKKGKNVIFTLKLANSTLVGYDLGKRTKKFVKKIGRANAAVLPYCISIEDGVATSLAPKYYLAISYPKLTMGQFMTISTVPGAIVSDLEKPFK